MELLHPETGDNPDALEGDASHELAATMVLSHARAGTGFPTEADTVGQCASNGVEWTADSYEGAKMYADDILAVMRETNNYNPHVEEFIAVPRIHPDLGGTPDCWVFDGNVMTLHVWDYKYGRLVVEVPENDQIIEYAVGVLDAITGDSGLADQQIKVVMTVVQPRAYHRNGTIRRWTVQGSDLRGYANQLEAIEAEASGPNPTCRATPVGCRDCSARHACETLQRASMLAISYIGKPTPSPLRGDALGLELKMLDDAERLIAARLSGLKAQAEGEIRNGETVPGWAMAPGDTRERWTRPPAEVFALGDMMGVNLRQDPKPITPKQARDKAIDDAVISAYSEKPKGALKLVSSTKTTASAVFKRI